MAISLQREMNRLFDEFLFPEGRLIEGGNGGRSLACRTPGGAMLGCGAGVWSPRVDVHEDDKAIRVHADLPGIPKEKVSVDVTSGNVLVISGENEEKRESPAGERGYRVQERCYGRFERRIGLPATVDHGKVEAKMENGVLNITLPKTTDAQARRITVK